MAFRSSNYPLTGLGFATGQNSDASSETSLDSADSGNDISMLDFTVSDTDGVSGPSSIDVGNTGTVTQNFTGESSRFSVIKGVDQNFTWSSSDTSVITVSSGDFTVTATAENSGTATVSSDFHDRYNTTSSEDGGSTSITVPVQVSVTTDPATNIEQTSATLNGSVTVSSGISGDAFFEWAESGNAIDSNTTSQTQIQSTTSFSKALTSGGSQTLGSSITGSQAGDQVRPVSWDNNTGRLAAGSLDSNVYVYDQNISLLDTLTESNGEIRGIAWDPFNGRLASSSSFGPIRIYDQNLNLLQTHTDGANTSTGMDWNPVNGNLVVGNQDERAYVYSGSGGMNLDQTISAGVGSLFDVGFGHFNGRLAVGGQNGDLALLSPDSNGNYVLDNIVNISPQNVTYIDFDPNQDRLVAVSADADAEIRNGTTLNLTNTLTDEPDRLRGAAWDPVNGRLATAGDNSVYIYDNSLNLIQSLFNPPNDFVLKANWDINTGRLAVSSNDTNTYVFESSGLLSSNTTYDYRAVFEYSGNTLTGDTESFTTN